jgi:hypothetical protein
MSGTLNGVAFNNAGYQISATADPATLQSYSILGVVPVDYILATTTITIDGFSPVTFSDPLFGIASGNLNAVSAGDSLVGFATQLGTNNDVGLGPVASGAPLSLTQVGSLSGSLITFTGLATPGTATWVTSGGSLVLTGITGTGNFTITQVPEPSTIVFGSLATCTILVIARRRRTAKSAV